MGKILIIKSRVIAAILLQPLMLLTIAHFGLTDSMAFAEKANTMLSPAIQINLSPFQSQYLNSLSGYIPAGQRDMHAKGTTANNFEYQHKSIAAVSEEEIHQAIDAAIYEEASIAFDATKPADYYFPQQSGVDVDIEIRAQRLLEHIIDYPAEAKKELKRRLSLPFYKKKLKNYFQLIKYAINNSPHKKHLLNYRYMVMFSHHPAILSADVLEHAGRQTKRGYFIPTVFLPVYLLEFIDEAGSSAVNTGFRYILEHADFHLRGNPQGVKINGHDYRSKDEYEMIKSIWQGYRLFQAEILKQGKRDISFSEVKNYVQSLVTLGAITHIRLIIPDVKNREEDIVATIKADNMRVESEAVFDLIASFKLPDNYSVSVQEETYQDGTLSGQKITVASIVTPPVGSAQVEKVFRDDFGPAMGGIAPASYPASGFIEQAPRQLGDAVIERYHSVHLQGHVPVLDSLRGDLLRLNLMVKDKMEEYARVIDNQCSFLISLFDKAYPKYTITRRELLDIRRQLDIYNEMVVSISSVFRHEPEEPAFKDVAGKLLKASQGLTEAIEPAGMRIYLEHPDGLRGYNVIGVIDRDGRILIHSKQQSVFETSASKGVFLINEEIISDIRGEFQFILLDSEADEVNLSTDDIWLWLYPSKKARSGTQKGDKEGGTDSIQRRSVGNVGLVSQAI